MTSDRLLSARKARVEFYVAAGVSVVHPLGVFEVQVDDSIETLGRRFLEDIHKMSAATGESGGPSMIRNLKADWAVLRAGGMSRAFRSPAPFSEFLEFQHLEPGHKVILVTAAQKMVNIGEEEIERPVDESTVAGCCSIS
eukprot:Hpha_TRINITY_DN18010_c0_g1::TRINITY_DN18010_c0_g1_i1::g.1180::m.1180